MDHQGSDQLEQTKRERDQLEQRALLAETRLAQSKACMADQERFYKRQVDDNRAIAFEAASGRQYCDQLEQRALRAETRFADQERWCKRQVDDNRALAQEAACQQAQAEQAACRLSRDLAYKNWLLTRPEQSNEPPRDDLLPAPQTQAKQVQPPRSSKEGARQVYGGWNCQVLPY